MTLQLHTEIIGEGSETFVISCGLSQTTANWRAFARKLSRKHPEVSWILFDPRGQGRSELGQRPYCLEDHTGDLLSVIEKNTWQPVTLIGFSHGGRVALNFAAYYPQHIENLVLVSTAVHASPTRKTLLRSWYELLKIGGIKALAWGALPSIIGPGLLENFQNQPEMLVKGMESRNTTEGLTAMLEGMQNYPPALADARLLTCPTLFMRGEKDPLLNKDDDLLFKQALSDCKIQTFPHAGHTLALEEPELFWKAICDFKIEQESCSDNFTMLP